MGHSVQTVDHLIAECEELHLMGLNRVPEAMEPRLRELATECPSSASGLHAGVTIARLMDQLFDLEDALLGRRVDRSVSAAEPE